MKKHKLTWLIYIVAGILLVVADQAAKRLALTHLKQIASAPAIPHIFDFVYVENRGAAFGIMKDTRWFLVAFTLALMMVVVFFVYKQRNKSVWLLSGATLICAGGIGNLIDRVFSGYVVDYIHLLFMDFPVFNIADICVCTGTAVFAIAILIMPEEKRSEKDNG